MANGRKPKTVTDYKGHTFTRQPGGLLTRSSAEGTSTYIDDDSVGKTPPGWTRPLTQQDVDNAKISRQNAARQYDQWKARFGPAPPTPAARPAPSAVAPRPSNAFASRGSARGGTRGGNGLMMPRARRSMTGAHGMGEVMTDMTRGSVPKFASNGLMMRRSSRGAAPSPEPGPVSREAAPTVGGEPATAEALPGVSGRMQTLLESDSPYLDRARTRGLQHANRRGLLSSSIAAGASEAAAIDAALPIAQADANIAAGERAMRSQEFQQLRAIRSQELMQQRGFDHDAAQKEADRELSELLQARDHRVQQLMQTERLDHDAAQQQASRELQATLQQRAHAHASREARRQRQFAGDQAGKDRSQQRGLQRRTIESTERLARDTAIRDINSDYQRHVTAISLNTNIPVEERRALEEHFAFIRDQTMQAVEQTYDVDLEWSSTQRPEEG